MSPLCFECEDYPGAFKCLRCREDLCEACVPHHICADDEDDEEPDE